ncbi:VWA domain-containing protein [uncultured Kriegella sp.]|uniref:VWA domain-containing protein n=1 Tax=uncultured Kriegella sp. TaxID=1798910 RepID=UPI0030D9F332|tara:strand:+ start:201341 stop:203365 length:2025 start_codon:yes stop_codon:yes gene_type:complete
MQVVTLLWILLAAIAALAIVFLQYYYRSKKNGRLSLLLSFLRFIAIFGLLLLLINPKFSKFDYTLEKVNLVVLTDNSTSVAPFHDIINAILNKIGSDAQIKERFNVKYYQFGSNLSEMDSLSFRETNTDIGRALSATNDIYATSKAAAILLTDGNQTLGENYEFSGTHLKLPVYSVVVGDTTKYEDLGIGQINANRYAFLKNKFPLEVHVTYNGPGNRSSLSISINGSNVHRETIDFSKGNGNSVVNVLLNAASVGTKNIQVTINPLESERNTANNAKNAIVEVIDEKTNITIVSDVLHPDIGTLKKAIESNEQRSVNIKKPSETIKEVDNVDLFVLYQPNRAFAPVYDYIEKKNTGVITITGTKTDFNFLNTIQKRFRIEDNYPVQEVFSVKNEAFSKFDISDFSLEDFPPLESSAGPIGLEGEHTTLLKMQIKGVDMSSPLFAILEGNNRREAVLFGENLWKWRVQSYRNNRDFKNFDDFIGKLILYLSSSKSKSRLNVDYNAIYQGSNDVKISATYFDEAFVFDGNADISINVTNEDNIIDREFPLLLKGGFYEVDLGSLPVGNYSFKVSVENKNQSKSGNFTIMDFDVEKQFSSSNYMKLNQLSKDSEGAVYFPAHIDSLIQNMSSDERFVPTQKGKENIVSLIDFRFLLALIATALALEWTIRKYNGLI